MKLNKRTYNSNDLKVECRETGEPFLTGHASVFDTIADGGWFREKVAPGAFKKSIKENDIRMLWNHNSDIVMDRNKIGNPNGKLKLREDEQGLFIQAYPSNTEMMRGYLDMIERGDVNQMSFGFIPLKTDWKEEKGEKDLRILREVELWEVSPVTFPFYEDTDISLKAEHENWLKQNKPIYKSKIFRRRLDLSLNYIS